MLMRLFTSIAVFGFVLAAPHTAAAQVPGASPACKARCETVCKSIARVSKGECMLKCTGRCRDGGKKKQ
jgi:hypothetical protein